MRARDLDHARKAARHNHREAPPPLYTVLDTMNSLEYFGRTAVYGEPLELASGITTTFHDAGHILGSACVLLELNDDGERRTVLFSGDLGNAGRPLLRNPATPSGADVVVMETTYGDRLHKQMQPSIEEMYTAITDTFDRGGNVIIPTFALERAQDILFYLREGVAKGRLPRSTQVFLDSPMAISATECSSPKVIRSLRHFSAKIFSEAVDFFWPSILEIRSLNSSRIVSISFGL